MQFSRLFPESGSVDVERHVPALDLGGRAPADRPFTVANFVASLDGRASVQGRSGGLGDDGDKTMFRALRRASDAVLVGTRTMETENYGRIVADPEARKARAARGLEPEPIAVTVTRSGRLPLGIPLFAEPEARVVVYSAAAIDLGGTEAQVQVVRIPGQELSFTAVLRHLRSEHGVRLALCEGGPAVLGAMLREGVLDQLCLSLAGKLAGGGDAPAITAGPALPQPAAARLEEALERSGTLFLRYSIGSAEPVQPRLP